MIEVVLGEPDQGADPGHRVADRLEQALRIAKRRLDRQSKRRELEGCVEIHA